MNQQMNTVTSFLYTRHIYLKFSAIEGQSRGAMGAKWTQEQTKALHAFLPVTQSIVKVGEEAPPPPPPLSLPPPPPPAPAPVPAP